MAAAAMMGMGSGALHAVSGPDHTLSLMSLSAVAPRRALCVGLLWGVGHSIGTLVLSALLLWVLGRVELEGFATWSDRVAGIALLLMGLRGALAKTATAEAHGAGESTRPLAIGLVHGITGAAALVLMLPGLVQGSALERAVYLAGFAVGSSLAMGLFTGALAFVARRRWSALRLAGVARVASWASVVLGAAWLWAA